MRKLSIFLHILASTLRLSSNSKNSHFSSQSIFAITWWLKFLQDKWLKEFFSLCFTWWRSKDSQICIFKRLMEVYLFANEYGLLWGSAERTSLLKTTIMLSYTPFLAWRIGKDPLVLWIAACSILLTADKLPLQILWMNAGFRLRTWK